MHKDHVKLEGVRICHKVGISNGVLGSGVNFLVVPIKAKYKKIRKYILCLFFNTRALIKSFWLLKT